MLEPKREVEDAHAMLDRLGAPGRQGGASIRERLDSYLCQLVKGRPLPTREQVGWARFGPGLKKKDATSSAPAPPPFR